MTYGVWYNGITHASGACNPGSIPGTPTKDYPSRKGANHDFCMRFTFHQITDNAVTIMRRLGYVFQYQKEHEMSFVRPLGQGGFPRFHCYVKTESGRYLFSIHLDQKKETYGQETRHHGEYTHEGAVKEEIERIQNIMGDISLLA